MRIERIRKFVNKQRFWKVRKFAATVPNALLGFTRMACRSSLQGTEGALDDQAISGAIPEPRGNSDLSALSALALSFACTFVDS
jgi:hypothetical protein